MLSNEQLREVNYKLNAIIKFIAQHNGDDYLFYNRTCHFHSAIHGAHIIEYVLDIKWLIKSCSNDKF